MCSNENEGDDHILVSVHETDKEQSGYSDGIFRSIILMKKVITNLMMICLKLCGAWNKKKKM